jgi:hypothetical protein
MIASDSVAKRAAAYRATAYRRGRRTLAVEKDWTRARWLRISWIGFMVAATSLPYLVNYAATPEGFHYTWIVPPYHQDSLAYMAWSEQAARGSLLFKIKYTALPHEPFLFHPLFLVTGWLKALLSWDIGVVHLMVKGIGVALFWLAYFRYVDWLKLNRAENLAATLLVGTSSGFGWFYYRLVGLDGDRFGFSADLWMPDINTFWSLMWNPLFPYSLTLLLVSVYLLDRGTEEADARSIGLAGLAAGFLTLIHPYHVPLLFTLAAAVALIRRRSRAFGLLVRYYGFAIPFVAVVFLISRLHPLASEHSASGEMTSPYWTAQALGFGLPLLLAFAGVVAARGAVVKKFLVPVAWIVLALVSSHLPFWFQRKLIFGAHVPIGILAGVAWAMFAAKISEPWRTSVIAAAALLTAALTLPTQIFHLLLDREIVRRNDERAYYMSDGLREAMHFLRAESAPADLVFAAGSTSTLVPAFAGNTVLWGHWAMSVDLSQTLRWKDAVFEKGATEAAGRELRKAGVKYVLVDDAFRESFGDPAPEFSTQYRKVFEKSEAAIYRSEKSG